MIDERKIDFVANNLSMDIWEKNKKTLEKMIRSAYIEGFKEGTRKAAETCSRCDGQDENFEHGADVCKLCARNKAARLENCRKAEG